MVLQEEEGEEEEDNYINSIFIVTEQISNHTVRSQDKRERLGIRLAIYL